MDRPSEENSISFLDQQTKTQLLERNPALLGQLFNEINPFLVKMCSINSIYQEDAQDVIHSTWEKFFSNLDQFEGRSKIRTFICGILFNKIREFRRSKNRIVFEEDIEITISRHFTPEGWWRVPPDDPEYLSEVTQLVDFVRDCLESLSEQQKAAFLLREIEEAEAPLICKTLNINLSHLRVLLFRAKDKIRKCVDGKSTLSSSKSKGK